ncbi:hypothetical protein GGI04_004069 [Coemansia thaxteri]|nr:hypothetical protein GGI04_004069 [Coemansia thaxteri]KAJ2468640.1 hypothetical protein GGI02_003640 [Coemansia sp. RSA 2322]
MRKATSGASSARSAATGSAGGPSSRSKSGSLKQGTAARAYNQSAPANFWELPSSLTAKEPSRVQSVLSIASPAIPSQQPQPATIGLKTPGTVLRQRGNARAASASASQIISIDGSSQEVERIELDSVMSVQKKPRNTPEPASGNKSKRAVSSRPMAIARPPATIVLDEDGDKDRIYNSVDVDDDDDFVEIVDKRKPLKQAARVSGVSKVAQIVTTRTTEPPMAVPVAVVSKSAKLVRTRSVEEVCLPSSPPLLRSGSPTITRHNSQSQQQVQVLDTTGDAPRSGTPSFGFVSASRLFSQETLVSGLSRTNTAATYSDRANSASTVVAHNTRLPSSGIVPNFRRTPSATKDSLKGVDAELPDDPIDEFCSQGVGALARLRQQRTFGPRLEPIQSDPLFSDAVHSPAAGAKSGSELSRQGESSPILPGISQWYHDNHDEYIGVGEDSDGLSAAGISGDSDMTHEQHNEWCAPAFDRRIEAGHDDPVLVDRGQGGRTNHAPTNDVGNANPPSSPLEGFCDLRAFSGNGDSSTDIYLNQFAPTRQQPSQQRSGRGRRHARSSSSSRQSSSRSRERSSRPARGGRQSRRQQRGGVRPVNTSRIAPQVAAGGSATQPIFYNHYAEDPFLDIAPSMNFESGNMFRFG